MLSSWSASACGLPERTVAAYLFSLLHLHYLFCSSHPLYLSLPLYPPQQLSVSLSSSVHLCSFPPRLAARSGLCTRLVVSLYIYVLSVSQGSLASLSLAVVALAGSRDCFSGSYGALSHTWAFIKSLILKDKFEYLY